MPRNPEVGLLDRFTESHSCCICARRTQLREGVIESRPTGHSFGLEKWLYCRTCWSDYEQLRTKKIEWSRVLLDQLLVSPGRPGEDNA